MPDIWTEVCGKAGACRFLVGGDAYIAPLESYEFAENFRKSGLCRRGDVGIDPYAYLIVIHKTRTAQKKRYAFFSIIMLS